MKLFSFALIGAIAFAGLGSSAMAAGARSASEILKMEVKSGGVAKSSIEILDNGTVRSTLVNASGETRHRELAHLSSDVTIKLLELARDVNTRIWLNDNNQNSPFCNNTMTTVYQIHSARGAEVLAFSSGCHTYTAVGPLGSQLGMAKRLLDGLMVAQGLANSEL